MSSPQDAAQALARRLRQLREEHWPNRPVITQSQLAEALGGTSPLSISLISSWEKIAKPTVPPRRRLEAYATFFATTRSIENEPFRILPLSELTDDERAARKRLLNELLGLRSASTDPSAAQERIGGGGLWDFGDQQMVHIVCGELAPELQAARNYSDPASPDYVALYTYTDLDALVDLYGHIRAVNPTSKVLHKKALELTPDDYTTHLVLLGGVDWNTATRAVLKRVEMPVWQIARQKDEDIGGFRVTEGGQSQVFTPQLDNDGQLLEDVGHFYRAPNPFNTEETTVTICNGSYGRGTLGVVRALTDERFRDRNEAFAATSFGTAKAFSLITRVQMLVGQPVTPDWTVPENRLHEWVEPAD